MRDAEKVECRGEDSDGDGDGGRDVATAAALRWPAAGWMLGAMVALSACGHTGSPFPWTAGGDGNKQRRQDGSSETASVNAEVTTANKRYDRVSSQVLVRRIARPTRANLDYAAYHANFMNADPAPEGAEGSGAGKRPDTSHPFGGALEVSTLTGALAATPLTADERSHPLALAPLIELLTSKHIPGSEALEDAASHVRAETWGLGGGPQLARQLATLAYLHDSVAAGHGTEIWIKVEFAPWFKDFSDLPDDDGDGFGAVYGRIPVQSIGRDADALVRFIREDYAGKVLSPGEVKAWAHQLASYWYPSYNTDLVPPAADWPDSDTEPQVTRELGGESFPAPAVVMRGKPQGKPVYNVFLVAGSGVAATGGAGAAAGAAKASAKILLRATKPSPDPAPVVDAVRKELAAHGGSWNRWADEVAPVHQQFRKKLSAIPAGAKATAGSDGFLFFGQSVAYAVAGDLGKQRRGRNPIPSIVQWKRLLADHGVDLLFVPIPTKEEIFPDKLAPGAPIGQVVNPFERKFLLDLGEKGVEVVDLLPAFLRERSRASSSSSSAGTALYQAQDTHWSDHGLELAARTIAERIKRYPWYKDIAAHRQKFTTREAPFTRHGDLHSRLPEAEKSKYAPEALVGQQVIAADGVPYDDDPESPIVVLGDSFTGVYELMDCEHAGVSAHLAKELGYPVDLVMSYGGGPNVRQKLLRRGVAALDAKRLVIWMMTARDLNDFWEGWQPAASK